MKVFKAAGRYAIFDPTQDEDTGNYEVNVRIIVFTVVSIFLILMSIYFIKAYAAKKQNTLQIMSVEANLIENAFTGDIGYSEYFLKILLKQIGKKYEDLHYINDVLQKHISSYDATLGWRKYVWVDSNFYERATSSAGIIENPKKIEFIKDSLKDTDKNRIKFFVSRNEKKNNSLKLFFNLRDKNSAKYKGSVILSYDMATLIRRLEAGKRKSYVNFVILDEKSKIVLQSKQNMESIIDGSNLSEKLSKVLSRIDFRKNGSREMSYLNMITGENYYIRKIDHLPFVLIINLEVKEIKNDILSSVIRKFVEIAVFATIFLFIVISIYRREVWLRAKAEQATVLANRATKAKSDFLAYTAHEIRSPLGFILTGSEIMMREMFGTLPSEYKEYAEGIHQSSKLILEFITDILDETQVIEGKFKIINATVNIEEVIKKAIKLNKARFNDRKVAIVYIASTHNLPFLVCDAKRIAQIFGNIISNAVKYSRDGSQVTVTARLKHDCLEVEVIDSGIGMNKEEIQRALGDHGPSFKKKHDLIN